MSVSKITRKLSFLLPAFLALLSGTASAGYGELNMPESVTKIGREIYDLHMLVFWIVTIVGIGVFAVIIYSLLNHRKSKGAVAAQFHENTTIEVVWTAIPLIILVLIAIPATKALLQIEDTTNSDLTIKATGWQWKWEYEYVDDKVASGKGIHFFSSLAKASNDARQLKSGVDVASVDNYLLDVDNRIVVPVGKKVRILTTAADVIHAWWVPELAMKRDAIPGFINESWFKAEKEGVYRGQCAELCGKDHGFMPIVVEVKSEEGYKQWAAEQTASASAAAAAVAAASDKTFTMEELMAQGEKVYNSTCAACHGATGAGIPGVFPAMAGSKIATGDVNAHIDIVKNGKAGTAMSAFGKQLNAVDMAAVITYERNAFGNNTGDVVQPSQIAR